jgi:hypothetical protein
MTSGSLFILSINLLSPRLGGGTGIGGIGGMGSGLLFYA